MLNFGAREKTYDDTRPEVRDVLDYDKNINRRVIEFNKRFIENFDDNVRVDTQLDKTVEQRVINEVAKVSQILEAKEATVEKALNSVQGIDINKQMTKTATDEVVNNAELIRFYNDLIRSYLSIDVNQMTRAAIETNIQELNPYVNALVYSLNKFLDTKVYVGPIGTASSAEKYRHMYLTRLITTLSIVSIIQKSMFRKKYEILNEGNIGMENDIYYDSKNGNVPIQNYIDDAFNQSVQKLVKDDVIKRREDLITSDQTKALSPVERKQLRRLIFGKPTKGAALSAAELAQIEADTEQGSRFNVLRNQDREELNQAIEQRILMGLPPNEIIPETLPAESYPKGNTRDMTYEIGETQPPVGEYPPQEGIKTTVYVKPMSRDLTSSFKTEILNRIRGINFTNNVANNIKEVKTIKKDCEQFWVRTVFNVSKKQANTADIRAYNDRINENYPFISDNQFLQTTAGGALNYAKSAGDRARVMTELNKLGNDTTQEIETYLRNYYAENPQFGLVGDGRKIRHGLAYEDTNNNSYYNG